MSDVIEDMLARGWLKAQTDELGRTLYAITEAMFEERPDLAKHWMEYVNKTLFDLWSKGYVDIEFKEDSMQVTTLPNMEVAEKIDELTPTERDVLASFIRMELADGN